MDADRVTATLIVGAAQTIHSAARAHKQAEAQHRRQARQLMRQLDQLRAECAAHGIAFEIETTQNPEKESS